MSHRSLVTLTEPLVTALTEHELVVPNRRLQQHCAAAFDARQLDAGRSVWRAARVTTLEDHLAARFHAGVARDLPGPARLVNKSTERLLWLVVAPPGAGANPDLLVEDVMAAWHIAHRWSLWPHIEAAAGTETHDVFLVWAERMRRQLLRLDAITAAELPDLLRRWTSTDPGGWPPQFATYGFEVTPRAIEALWLAQQAAGLSISRHEAAKRSAQFIHATTYATSDLELRAAGAWARATLLRARADGAERDVRIGIAIPDLEARYASITRELDALFTPAGSPAPEQSCYNISSGIPLADVPLVRAALDLLSLASAPSHARRVQRLLASRLVGALERVPRPLSERLPERFDLTTMARMTGTPPLQDLVDAISAWSGRAPCGVWAKRFDEFLNAARWAEPSSLPPGAFNIRRALQQVLQQMTQHADLPISWSAREAVAHLQDACRQELFAPKRPDAPIQVLGYLETAGLEFSHLWITGLDAPSWPAVPQPNPFLPSALQRRCGVPRSTIEAEHDFAVATTARWLGSASHVRFSCATSHGEETRLPSPLITGWTPDTAFDHTRRRHPLCVPRTGTVREAIDDASAPADPGALKRRSSAVLRDQRTCPFKAFARHRLAIEEPREPHTFPDAIDRGNLLHRVLELAGQASLGGPLSDATLTIHIDIALTEWARFPAAVRVNEAERCRRIVTQWLRVERSRAPHRIEAVEAQANVELGGITFRLRIDRIDRNARGRVVIDYKTGAISGADIGAAEPQLPLYALALPDSIAVLYGHLREGSFALRGIVADSAVEHANASIRLLEPAAFGCDSWVALRARWREELNRLAVEYVAGAAPVAPHRPSVCDHCGLQSVCRIGRGAGASD